MRSAAWGTREVALGQAGGGPGARGRWPWAAAGPPCLLQHLDPRDAVIAHPDVARADVLARADQLQFGAVRWEQGGYGVMHRAEL